jgi:hypothetical protein
MEGKMNAEAVVSDTVACKSAMRLAVNVELHAAHEMISWASQSWRVEKWHTFSKFAGVDKGVGAVRLVLRLLPLKVGPVLEE